MRFYFDTLAEIFRPISAHETSSRNRSPKLPRFSPSRLLDSPALRLVERAMRIRQHGRELTRRKDGLADVLVEGCYGFECLAFAALRVENADGLVEFRDGHLDWRLQVRVARNQYGAIVAVLKRIDEKMGRDVDIGTFLFRLDNPNEWTLPGCWIGEGHGNDMGEVMTVNALRVDRRKGAEIEALAEGLLRIVGTRVDLGREILDADDIVVRGQHVANERQNVEPLVRSPFQRSVVEVERIDVNHCFQRHILCPL